MIEIHSPNPMLWRGLSAAYDAGCIGDWHRLPDWHKAQIIAVHEIKQELSAAQLPDED